jgi:hypothetical protein
LDSTAVIQALSSNDFVYIQQVNNAVKGHIFQVTGTPVDAVGYTKIPITLSSTLSSDLEDGQRSGLLLYHVFGSGATEIDPVFTASPAGNITVTDTQNWTTAFSWGDHSTNGYLTSFTETDPIWSAVSNTVTTDIDNLEARTNDWNTAFGWGDHSTNGYLTSFTETDPIWSGVSNQYVEFTDLFGGAGTTGVITSAGGDAGNFLRADGTWAAVITTESDPVFSASVAANITTQLTNNWSTAFSWGDHATNGYLTSFTETDPVWVGVSNQYVRFVDGFTGAGTTGVVSSAPGDAGNFLRADGTWASPSTASETDPIWSAASNLYVTVTDGTATNLAMTGSTESVNASNGTQVVNYQTLTNAIVAPLTVGGYDRVDNTLRTTTAPPTTPALLPGTVISNVPPGRYVAQGSISLASDRNNRTITTYVFIDGVQTFLKASTVQSANETQSVTFFPVITTTNSLSVVDMRWSMSIENPQAIASTTQRQFLLMNFNDLEE